MEKNKTAVELKSFSDKSLSKAKAQYEKEAVDAEVEYAQKKLKIAKDEINAIDREIALLQEKKKPHQEIIKVFK